MNDTHIPHAPQYRRFFELFNEGDFFEAHEVLEDLWATEVPPLRAYYKGLIMVAVAVCHWQRGNHGGARRLWIDGDAHLSGYPEVYEDFALGDFRRRMAALFAPLVADSQATPQAPTQSALPVIGLVEEERGSAASPMDAARVR